MAASDPMRAIAKDRFGLGAVIHRLDEEPPFMQTQPPLPPPVTPLTPGSGTSSIDGVAHQAGSAVANAWDTLQSLPWAAHAGAAAGLILGLAIWLRGRDLMRPAFALFGLLKGGMIGFFAPALLGIPSVMGFPAPWVGLAIGATTGFGAGVALYRFAMSICGALVVGLAAFLIAGASMGLQLPSPPTESGAESSLASAGREPPEAEGQEGPHLLLPPPTATPGISSPVTTPETESAPGTPTSPQPTTTTDDLVAAAKRVSDKAKAFVEAWGHQFSESWKTLSSQQQGTLVVAAVGGLVGGFLLGSLMPTKSAAALTSLLGSALTLFCMTWLTRALEAPGRELFNRGPAGWLAIWLTMAAIGFAIQIMPTIKRARKQPEE